MRQHDCGDNKIPVVQISKMASMISICERIDCRKGGGDMNIGSHREIKQLTLGDLIVAVTEAAFEVIKDEDKAYEIAGLVLVDLLQTSAPEAAEHLLATYNDIPIQ
jgi:hypothetical protein